MSLLAGAGVDWGCGTVDRKTDWGVRLAFSP